MRQAATIVIFASGNGTNAVNIIRELHAGNRARVSAVYCNREGAGVIGRAGELGVPVVQFGKPEMQSGWLLTDLREKDPDLIVLAGFLWLLPPEIVAAWSDRILNIHPALLPGYGGKGMYGDKVHRAVLADGASRSGITIHLVNERYDEGAILFQAFCPVNEDDTPETLASRIHELEYTHYPRVILGFLDDAGL